MIIYKCNRCDKQFKQKTDYNRHINRKNPCKIILDKIILDKNNKSIKYKCNTCNKFYSTQGNLTKHIKKFHSIIINNNNNFKIKYNLDTCDTKTSILSQDKKTLQNPPKPSKIIQKPPKPSKKPPKNSKKK